MSLRAAIVSLEAEITALGHGGSNQPREGSAEWFLLRGKLSGLNLLRRMDEQGLGGNARGAEVFYKAHSKELKVEAEARAREAIKPVDPEPVKEGEVAEG